MKSLVHLMIFISSPYPTHRSSRDSLLRFGSSLAFSGSNLTELGGKPYEARIEGKIILIHDKCAELTLFS